MSNLRRKDLRNIELPRVVWKAVGVLMVITTGCFDDNILCLHLALDSELTGNLIGIGPT